MLLNSVHDTLVTGLVHSYNRVEFNAGVDASWTLAKLTGGAITTAELTAGNIYVQGAGQVNAEKAAVLQAGGDVKVQAAAQPQTGQANLIVPYITQQATTIYVVTGSRQVAVGTITVPEVHWVPTTVTTQVGFDTVSVGSYFHTMDATLTQDGYYNPNAPAGTKFRDYFVEHVDYLNVQVNWAAYNATAPSDSNARYDQLDDNEKKAVLGYLGYRRLYDFSYTNAKEQRTVNGILTTSDWTPAWASNATTIESFTVAGWDDKYVRLQTGADADVLRVVARAARRRPRRRSARTGTPRWPTTPRTARPSPAVTTTGADDRLRQQPGAWAVSYDSNGQRHFSINDYRTGANAVQYGRTPNWSSDTNFNAQNDLAGRFSDAPQSYFDTTSSVAYSSTTSTYDYFNRNGSYVGYIPHYNYVDTSHYSDWTTYDSDNTTAWLTARTFDWAYWDGSTDGSNTYWAEINSHPNLHNPRYDSSYGEVNIREYTTNDFAGNPYRLYMEARGRNYISEGHYDDHYQDETYNNYAYNWTSNSTAITDPWLTIKYQVVDAATDVTENRPRYETYDTLSKQVVNKQVTQWETQLITQPQVVYTTHKTYEDLGPRSFAAFAGDSIRRTTRSPSPPATTSCSRAW